jgi:hypothetical protein
VPDIPLALPSKTWNLEMMYHPVKEVVPLRQPFHSTLQQDKEYDMNLEQFPDTTVCDNAWDLG